MLNRPSGVAQSLTSQRLCGFFCACQKKNRIYKVIGPVKRKVLVGPG